MDIPTSNHPTSPRGTRPKLHRDPFALPSTEHSRSMPSHSYMDSHFSHREDEWPGKNERPIIVMDGLSHRRSNSYGYHPAKVLATASPPGKGKLYRDPYGSDMLPSSSSKLHGSNRSLSSLKEEECDGPERLSKSNQSTSGRSSVCSLDSDSSPSSRNDISLSDKQRRGHSSDKLVARGFSSGEYHRPSSKGKNTGEKSKEGGLTKISRFWSDIQLNTSSKKRSDKVGASRRSSGGSSGHVSSGSGGANTQSRQQKLHSSSDGSSGGKRMISSPVVFYKDDDPTYIHNSINLHLDMEVFDSSKKETFKMTFQSPVVKYGEVGEIPVLVVVSNIYAYIFKIVAPER